MKYNSYQLRKEMKILLILEVLFSKTTGLIPCHKVLIEIDISIKSFITKSIAPGWEAWLRWKD